MVVADAAPETLGVPVMVKVYDPEVVPLLPPPLPPPHAESVPRAAKRTSTPMMARHARRRAGMPRKTRKARSVAAPAFFHPPESAMCPLTALAAVVAKLTVAVPLVVEELRVIGEPETEQVGTFAAPLGELVSAHVTATVPLKLLELVAVMVELEPVPAETEAGVDPLSENEEVVTVTDAVPEPTV